MCRKVLVFTVYRHEIFWLGKRMHELEFLGAGVTGYMYAEGRIPENLYPVLC